MTGVEQRVTSAYHPQANGLVERQNRTVKDSLVKVLDERAEEWPYVIDGVLFAHRVSRHYSTKYSPFYLLYNRQLTSNMI
jgi:transposase